MSPQLAFHSLQWETLVCPPLIGLLVGLIVLFRLVQSIRSHLYVRRDKQLGETLAAQIKKKCQLIDKLSASKKEYAETEASLENAQLANKSLNIPSLIDNYKKVKRFNLVLMEELTYLVQETKKEKSKRSKQEEAMKTILKMLQSLEENMRITLPQGTFPHLPGGQQPSPAGLFPRSGPGS
ncbi:cTAGE family member 4-like [Lemur catta]|uniref:cTAGE family member 4-like n=1 Tax=Lemur catta TaxID=9447 RepID=UPI001E266ABA|nr:cTAGE family member 4-like [Lemur catta]